MKNTIKSAILAISIAFCGLTPAPASNVQIGFYDDYGNQVSNNFTLTQLQSPIQYGNFLAYSTPKTYVMTNWPMTISNMAAGNWALAVRGQPKVMVLAVPPNDNNTWFYTSLINSNVSYYAKLATVFMYWTTNLDAWAQINPNTFTAGAGANAVTNIVPTNGPPLISNNVLLVNTNQNYDLVGSAAADSAAAIAEIMAFSQFTNSVTNTQASVTFGTVTATLNGNAATATTASSATTSVNVQNLNGTENVTLPKGASTVPVVIVGGQLRAATNATAFDFTGGTNITGGAAVYENYDPVNDWLSTFFNYGLGLTNPVINGGILNEPIVITNAATAGYTGGGVSYGTNGNVMTIWPTNGGDTPLVFSSTSAGQMIIADNSAESIQFPTSGGVLHFQAGSSFSFTAPILGRTFLTVTNDMNLLHTMHPDMSEAYQDMETNASFTLGDPVNVQSTYYNSTVIWVTNYSGSLITITPDPAWVKPAIGTLNVTNVTAISITINPTKWTNAIYAPLW